MSADDDISCLKHLLFEQYEFLSLCSTLLMGKNQAVAGNVAWVFANIVGDAQIELRDLLLRHTSVVDFLSSLINWNTLTPTLMSTVPWLCHNMVRVNPLPDMDIVINIFIT